MISAFHKRKGLCTKGDLTASTAVVAQGVPQGSSLSPCLFNLYMETYAEYLEENIMLQVQQKRKGEATMFVKRIKLMA